MCWQRTMNQWPRPVRSILYAWVHGWLLFNVSHSPLFCQRSLQDRQKASFWELAWRYVDLLKHVVIAACYHKLRLRALLSFIHQARSSSLPTMLFFLLSCFLPEFTAFLTPPYSLGFVFSVIFYHNSNVLSILFLVVLLAYLACAVLLNYFHSLFVTLKEPGCRFCPSLFLMIFSPSLTLAKGSSNFLPWSFFSVSTSTRPQHLHSCRLCFVRCLVQ